MTCGEWTEKHDVDNDEEVIVVKIEEKDMEYKKNVLKKAVHFMKDSFEKSVKVHNELR